MIPRLDGLRFEQADQCRGRLRGQTVVLTVKSIGTAVKDTCLVTGSGTMVFILDENAIQSVVFALYN